MKILLAADGSEFSRAAAEACCRVIAAPERTQLRIVAAFEAAEPMDISVSPEFSRELENAARRKAEEAAEASAAHIREAIPAVELTVQAAKGAPERVLLAAAEEWAADLIVIGSHCRGFWGRTLLGSITDTLVHNAPCSVFVVRKK